MRLRGELHSTTGRLHPSQGDAAVARISLATAAWAVFAAGGILRLLVEAQQVEHGDRHTRGHRLDEVGQLFGAWVQARHYVSSIMAARGMLPCSLQRSDSHELRRSPPISQA